MQLIVINVSVIFAFGLVITAIVFKGLMQAKEYDIQQRELQKRKALENDSIALQEPNRLTLSSPRNTPGTTSVR